MTDSANTKDHLLLRTIRGESVERPPVWAMRQAGRWDPEFRRIRGDLSFFEFSENVELAAEASLLPRRFGVDAIILFYDITTLPFAMGLPFTLQPNVGPVPDRVVRTIADVERMAPNPDPQRFQHIRDLLALVKAELKGELPVIVFAGAPFTVATYCIGTGKDLAKTRAFIGERNDVWTKLLDRLSNATVHFLNTLSDDGADVYQLFDSWAGMLSPDEYDRWADAHHRNIIAAADKIPRILFVKECPYLEKMTQSGADAISLGKCHDLVKAKQDYPELVFQGNVDQEILRSGTPDQVRDATRLCLEQGGGIKHIANLNHGCAKDMPVENFRTYVKTVRTEIAK